MCFFFFLSLPLSTTAKIKSKLPAMFSRPCIIWFLPVSLILSPATFFSAGVFRKWNMNGVPRPVQSRGLLLHHHFTPSAWTFFHFLPLYLFLNLESLGYSSLSLNVTPQKCLLLPHSLGQSLVFLHLITVLPLQLCHLFLPIFCQNINPMSSGILSVLFTST